MLTDLHSRAFAALLLALAGCAHAAAGGRHDDPTQLSAAQLLELADVLARGGDSLRAGQYYDAALRHGASETLVMPRLLRLYVADGQYRLAIEQAENCLRRHPSALDLRRFLATLYVAIDLVTDAAAQYRQVLREKPDDAGSHFALAMVLKQVGTDQERVDQHLREYLSLEPDGSHAEQARALLLTELP